MTDKDIFFVRVEVFPKPALRDPSAEEILRSLREFGSFPVQKLRLGKVFDLEINASNPDEAFSLARQLSDQFLANPQLEEFFISIKSVQR